MTAVRPLCVAILLCFAAVAPPQVKAQVTGQVTLDSDYRFRGISLDHSQPAVHADISWDMHDGGYAGGSLIASRNRDGGVSVLGVVGYGGYVWRPAAGPAWEAGLSVRHMKDDYSYNYEEAYVGLLTQDFTARLSWSPHNPGRRGQTLYSEIDSGAHLSPHWRSFVHAGLLTPLDGGRQRYDLRAGLAADWRDYEFQAALSHTNPVPAYGSHSADDGTAVVLSASRFF